GRDRAGAACPHPGGSRGEDARPDADPAARGGRCRRRGAHLRDAGPAPLRRPGQSDPPACSAPLSGADAGGDRGGQRGERRPGELSRLRHHGRDHGDLHRWTRGAAAPERNPSQEPREGGGCGVSHNIILRIATKVVVPFILIFALYVQFHGDYGPGGGFQAGVILAAGFVLYALVYGLENVKRVLPPSIPFACMAIGVLLYSGTGVVAILNG